MARGTETQGERDEHHSALPLDLLLPILQSHAQTYQVCASVRAALLPALRGLVARSTPCQVRVQIAQGQVTDCVICDPHGQVVLAGAAALAEAQTCQQIIWTVQPQEVSQATPAFALQHDASGEPPRMREPENQPVPLSWSARSVPRLVRALEAPVLRTVSRKQRLVLLLIDGRRCLADLCRLLHLPQQEVATLLNELESRDLLTWAPQPGTGHARKEEARD